MLQIQKNSRQVPTNMDVVKDKNYYDLVYAWFQLKSDWWQNIRYVSKKDASFVTIAEECNIDRRSASKYVKYLVSIGLLKYDDQRKWYVLEDLANNESTLVPYPVLSKLLHSLSHNSVSIYTHLLRRYVAAQEHEFIVTYKQLKDYIGISSSSSSNNNIIGDILDVLDRLGLITMELRQMEENKTMIFITQVANVLPAKERVVRAA